MRSIADSVHKLLCDQIAALELGEYYQIEKARIRGNNGSDFFFAGLRHNIAAIKSAESIDRCWVEEAQVVSRDSWNTLIPTIRAKDSEIWCSFNPDLATDATYQMFVAHAPPPDSVVVKVTHSDNPWFPDVLRKELEYSRVHNPDQYSHIWLGNVISILEGAIYANELRAVDAENRITKVPYDRTKPVHVAWDLGIADFSVLWFIQAFPFEYRVIDYVDGSQHSLRHYIEIMQRKGYVYGTMWLPHDARARSLGTGRSIEELMREAGYRVQVVPQLSIADGINALRTIFPQLWFDAEKCQDGLQYLRRYRYGEIKTLGVPTREPLHDDASHAADALRMAAVALKTPKTPPLLKDRPYVPQLSAWS